VTDQPITRRAPYPDPAVVAAGQAELVRGMPERARAVAAGLRRKSAAGETLGPDDRDLARALYGPRAVARAGLVEAADAHAEHAALRALAPHGPDRPARRRDRADRLTSGALTGLPLDAAAAGEFAAAWGAGPAAGLDPADDRVAGPAATAPRQDPRTALAQVTLAEEAGGGATWTVRPDLLDSGPDDRHVVVETDDVGGSRLRFGDGRVGRAVTGDDRFTVRLRSGNGTAGNVGADTIVHLVAARPIAVAVTAVRNPLAAAGGTDPEPVADAKLLGPTAYRHGLERAVTAEDYSTIAAAVPGVQGAATDLAWTGSWYEADVAIDALGRATPASSLLASVRAAEEQARRIGHDLRVDRPDAVPVDVTLRVCLAPDARQTAAAVALRARVGGLFHPDRLTFGNDLYNTRLVAEAMAVPGVVAATVVRLARTGTAGTSAPAVPAGGVLSFAPLELPAAGALTLDLVGGR
jgi:predicted phage baseplate assembly protein